MNAEQAKVGTRVRALAAFSGVPKGTEGVIDEDYGSGVMVAWELPIGEGHHGAGLSWFPTGRRRNWTRPLRDGFDKETELGLLEVVDQ